MQTFLPYPSFVESARVLDNKRLGKQRVEAWQILQTLLGESNGWRNHPAVKMWDGHHRELMDYGLAMCREWRERGYVDNVAELLWDLEWHYMGEDSGERILPPWFARPDFHSAHRAVLLAKNPAHYSQFGWTEPPAVRDASGRWPYVWPA